jgi:hypothetical protein
MNGYAKWFQLVLGLLITIALAFSGYAVAQIDTLKIVKLDKEQYKTDLSDIKTKIDCIYNWHLPPELRDK